MTRKEEIIYATLELASQHGLKSVSMSQIADKVGIKKPSLYNHFKSKDEIVNEMYLFIREKAKINNANSVDYTKLMGNRNLEEILLGSMTSYMSFLTDEKMLLFFKVLYSERSISSIAAQIMIEETNRMINSTKNLFYALAVHNKIKNENVDVVASSFAMTIHSFVDIQMDKVTANIIDKSHVSKIPDDVIEYIHWFSKVMEVKCDE